MKYIKNFESVEDKVNLLRKFYLLCINSSNQESYYKFTKGKKYKLHVSYNFGTRIKDDNKLLVNATPGVDDLVDMFKNKGAIDFRFGGAIFTSDKSLEDYNIRQDANKYNL
jgi:hypothetical protein